MDGRNWSVKKITLYERIDGSSWSSKSTFDMVKKNEWSFATPLFKYNGTFL